MGTLTGDGIIFNPSNQTGITALYPKQTSGWFFYQFTRTSGFSFSNSWVVGQTTDVMNLPARAKVFVYTYTPLRGDTNSWGGHYEDLQYEINSSGSWISVGRAGFVSHMQTPGYNISKHTDFCVFDFLNITNDFELRLRTRHLRYNVNGNVITSCAIGQGDASLDSNSETTRNGLYKQIIVQGFAQAEN